MLGINGLMICAMFFQSAGSFKDGSFLGGPLTPSSMAPLPEVCIEPIAPDYNAAIINLDILLFLHQNISFGYLTPCFRDGDYYPHTLAMEIL